MAPSPAPLIFGWPMWLILLVIATCMHLILLGRLPLEDADEATYAMVVREMREGGHYLTLSLAGSPWVDKPPLYFWLAAASARVFGFTEFALRLPSAIFGIAAVLLTALIIRQLTRNDEAALFGGLALIFFPLFLSASRNVRLDVPVATAILAALYCFLKGRAHPRWYLGVGVAIGLGLLLKSVVALLVLPLILLFSCIYRDWRWLKGLFIWIGAALGISIALPWHLYEALEIKNFLARYFGFQLGRAAENILESRVTASYALWVFFRHGQPWSALLVTGAVGWIAARLAPPSAGRAGWRSGGNDVGQAVWFALAAWLFVFSIFLLPVTKLITYFIPSYPFAIIFLGTLYAALKERYPALLRAVAGAALAIALAIGIREAFFDTRLYVSKESRDEKAIGLTLASHEPVAMTYLYEFPSDQSIQYYSRRTVKHITATNDDALVPPFHLIIPTPLISENEWLKGFSALYRGEYLALYRIE